MKCLLRFVFLTPLLNVLNDIQNNRFSRGRCHAGHFLLGRWTTVRRSHPPLPWLASLSPMPHIFIPINRGLGTMRVYRHPLVLSLTAPHDLLPIHSSHTGFHHSICRAWKLVRRITTATTPQIKFSKLWKLLLWTASTDNRLQNSFLRTTSPLV
jgi:hypothetical protein